MIGFSKAADVNKLVHGGPLYSLPRQFVCQFIDMLISPNVYREIEVSYSCGKQKMASFRRHLNTSVKLLGDAKS
jgi:hypothetical protein